VGLQGDQWFTYRRKVAMFAHTHWDIYNKQHCCSIYFDMASITQPFVC
jgi:hypothetical protein